MGAGLDRQRRQAAEIGEDRAIVDLTPDGERALASATVGFDRELERFFAAPLSERALAQLSSALAVVRGAATQAGAPD